ncbi:MAG: glycosyltransferase 87 family protein [Promethearchaeota archaeon]
MVIVIETVTMNLLGTPWDYIFQTLVNDIYFWYKALIVPSWSGWDFFIDSIFARTPEGYRARTRPIANIYTLFLMGNVVSDIRQFYYLFGSIQVIADFFTIYYLIKISNMLNNGLIRKIVTIYCFSPTIIMIGFARFDLVPTFFMVAAIYHYLNNRDASAGILLGLGIGFKLFPLAFLVAVFFLHIEKKEMKRFVKMALFVIVVLVLMHLPFLLFRFRYFKDFFTFYSGESITRPDTLIGVVDRWTNNSFDIILKWIFIITLIVVCILLIFRGPRNALQKTLSFIAAFLLFVGYIYSPQWTIWILPLLALDKKISFKIIGILECSNVLIFPYLYSATELSTGFSVFSLNNPLTILFSIFIIIRASALTVILFKQFKKSKFLEVTP